MRSYIHDYNIITPETLKEALDLLHEKPLFWKCFAGGTDLMPLFYSGKLNHKNYINISNFKELMVYDENKKFLKLGALTTFSAIQSKPFIKKEFPILYKAAKELAAPGIQNLATLGGNIANASPAADSPPVLLVLDAQIELISKAGSRTIPYHDFHKDYKKTALKDDEIICSLILPISEKNLLQYFRKVGPRKAQAISKISLAATCSVSRNKIINPRIALGSAAPIAISCFETEKILQGASYSKNLILKAQESLMREISPITDLRSTCDYRKQVAQNLLLEFIDFALGGK